MRPITVSKDPKPEGLECSGLSRILRRTLGSREKGSFLESETEFLRSVKSGGGLRAE